MAEFNKILKRQKASGNSFNKAKKSCNSLQRQILMKKNKADLTDSTGQVELDWRFKKKVWW